MRLEHRVLPDNLLCFVRQNAGTHVMHVEIFVAGVRHPLDDHDLLLVHTPPAERIRHLGIEAKHRGVALEREARELLAHVMAHVEVPLLHGHDRVDVGFATLTIEHTCTLDHGFDPGLAQCLLEEVREHDASRDVVVAHAQEFESFGHDCSPSVKSPRRRGEYVYTI